MTNKDSINDSTIRMIEFGILRMERQNVKTRKLKDGEIIKEIVELIKKEVDREE
ncbi:MAG: hypothetical protein K5769_02730 [Pseudobutyrivibrio sp.]|nr:hypothetical protein [Pseudobutyrivibrio sp.]